MIVSFQRLFAPLLPLIPSLQSATRRSYGQRLVTLILTLFLGVGSFCFGTTSALAGLTDDRFDGNIFALYAGNGALVPPKVPFAESLQRPDRPTLLVFFVDDSKDSKQYASVVSQLQAFYVRASDFVPINADVILPQPSYEPTEPGYYYTGVVPQTVLFNQAGDVVLNVKGAVAFEQVDDAFRQVFDLLPRSESVELKRRSLNEVSTELVPEPIAK